jgi:hypothetical protein
VSLSYHFAHVTWAHAIGAAHARIATYPRLLAPDRQREAERRPQVARAQRLGRRHREGERRRRGQGRRHLPISSLLLSVRAIHGTSVNGRTLGERGKGKEGGLSKLTSRHEPGLMPGMVGRPPAVAEVAGAVVAAGAFARQSVDPGTAGLEAGKKKRVGGGVCVS